MTASEIGQRFAAIVLVCVGSEQLVTDAVLPFEAFPIMSVSFAASRIVSLASIPLTEPLMYNFVPATEDISYGVAVPVEIISPALNLRASFKFERVRMLFVVSGAQARVASVPVEVRFLKEPSM